MSPVMISFPYLPRPFCACIATVLGLGDRGLLTIHSCGLFGGPGPTGRVGEFAIRKVIVHKANEDCIISIINLGVVLSILLAMEVEELVTLLHSLPILLLVLDMLVLLLTPAHDIPLGGVHSKSKKRLKMSRACKEVLLPILLLILAQD
jgi:hypothetical protein